MRIYRFFWRFLFFISCLIILLIIINYILGTYDCHRTTKEYYELEPITIESHLNQMCPNANSIIMSVIPGGRLGNHVWEYLSLWAWTRGYPGVWPVVHESTVTSLSKVFGPLSLSTLTDLANRCNASYLLQDFKKIPGKGNMNKLHMALQNTTRTRPFLLALPRYVIDIDAPAAAWAHLWLQLPFKQHLQEASQKILFDLAEKIRTSQKQKDCEPLEFVGVHVRRTDFSKYIIKKYTDAKVVDEHFFLNAMTEMRNQLKPRQCVFVVVSDDSEWCKKYLTISPDVYVAGDGNKNNPGLDLALLSNCNHTIFAYGTFGLTATIYNHQGRTIVYSGSGKGNAVLKFAAKLNWTIL